MNSILSFFSKFSAVLLLFTLAIFYLFTIRGTVGNIYPNVESKGPPFESSMERGRYAQVVSLSEKQTFNVDSYADFVRPDLAWYNGHYYPAFPPGVAVLAVPLYLAGKLIGLDQITTYSISALFSLFTAWVLFLAGKKIGLSTYATCLSVFIFTIGSFTLAYSVTLSAHPVSAFLIALSFLMSISIKKGGDNFLKFCVLWFCFGINLFIDYPNLFILFPLVFITCLKAVDLEKINKTVRFKFPMTLLYAGIVLLPILFLFVKFNMAHFQKPITFTNRYNLKVLDIQGIKYDKLSNDLFTKRSYSSRFNFARVYNGIHTLLFSTDRGLFFYAPIYLLAVIGFFVAYSKKENFWEIILVTFFADLIVYGSFDDPWGGWGYGPRYLIPTLPLLSLMVGRAIDYLQKYGIFTKIVVSFLFLYGAAVALLGALTTNAVPPSTEAPGLKMHDNFILNWNYLLSGKSSSFVYNTFFHNQFSPLIYFCMIFSIEAIIILFIIWQHRQVVSRK